MDLASKVDIPRSFVSLANLNTKELIFDQNWKEAPVRRLEGTTAVFIATYPMNFLILS